MRRGRTARRGAISLLAGVVLTLGTTWWLSLESPKLGYVRAIQPGGVWRSHTRTQQIFRGFVQATVANHGRVGSNAITHYMTETDWANEERMSYWKQARDDDLPGFVRGSGALPKRLGGDLDDYFVFDVAWGFPLRSMALTYTREESAGMLGYQDAIELSPGTRSFLARVRLPTRVLWVGFVLNGLFYAGLIFGPWQTVSVVRRRHRHVAGRCLRCGYDLAGLGACPECGPGRR